MPVYEFKCERCGRLLHRSCPMDERDIINVWCDNPNCDHDTAPNGERFWRQRMMRQKTVAAFSINGFSAKNGYSGGSDGNQ